MYALALHSQNFINISFCSIIDCLGYLPLSQSKQTKKQ